MRFGKRICLTFGALALGAIVSASAVAQVTTRLVTAGGAATSATIIPGGTVPLDVRLDVGTLTAPGTGLTGTGFRLSQSAPGTNGFFSITGRSFVGSPFDDTSSGTSDAIALAPPSNLLDPDNDDNLGRTTIGLAPVTPAANTLAANLTLTSSGTTPLGTYTISLTPVVSVASDDGFNDYPMAASYTVIVGQTLSVTKSGGGTGTVTSDVGAINCGATCSDIYPGTVVTLTAAPTGGSTFIGWSGGGCSGTGTCVVTVNAATTVDAQFGAPPLGLTVVLAGTGTGSVTSSPAGIDCPATACTAPFAPATVVTLTAVPAGGSTFTGWSGGGCSGTGTCVVTVNAAVSVTATFSLPSFTLTVTKAGNGAASGTVTSAPAGINCGATCSAPFLSGSTVTLTAVAPGAPGAAFTGWSGAGCAGTGTCVVTMSAAQAVTATFADATAPTTTLGTTPTDPSNLPNPQFTFSSNEAGGTFLCTLDGGAPIACTSPTTLTVGNGVHTFTAQAVDAAGNPGNIVSFTWTVAGVVAAVSVPIPTLNEWMLVLLALLVGSAGVVLARRRKA